MKQTLLLPAVLLALLVTAAYGKEDAMIDLAKKSVRDT